MNYLIGRLVLSSLCVGVFAAADIWWCSFCRLKHYCWAHNKWNKIASDIKLVFHSSTIAMMHGPIYIRLQRFSDLVILHTYLWRWNRQCFETSAYRIPTPGNYPEKSIQNKQHTFTAKRYAHCYNYYVRTEPSCSWRRDPSSTLSRI